MKKQVNKTIIATILWIVILITIVFNQIYATDGLILNVTSNKNTYTSGEKVEVNITLNKEVVTASFYLNYDSATMTYIESKTSGTAVKDYPDDNLVRVVYADMSENGTSTITLVFKLKDNVLANPSFSLSNTTMSAVGETEPYTQNIITGANSVTTITVTQQQEEVNTNTENNAPTDNEDIDNNNTSTNIEKTNNSTQIKEQNVKNNDSTTIQTKELPKTGENDTLIYLLIALVLTTIYLGYNSIKLGMYFKY